MHRRDAETVAESAAYVVLQRYGIDTSDYSFPYVVARWAQDRSVLTRNLNAIQRVAGTTIEGIEEGEQRLDDEAGTTGPGQG